jgi:hypothetical protein
MTPEQEASIRAVALATEADRWVAVARETNTPEQTYRAAALGLSIDDWQMAARAGATCDAALAAIRAVFFDEHGARQAAEEISRFAEDVAP